ncbi:hypothetical protein HRbin01_01800 [archaeon HR01]|nr:hypothetical protein HRbin01_01800 [archaeon HR01]
MNKIPLATAFLASIFFGLFLLATDPELWDNAPSHAYGLIGLIAVDVAVLAYVVGRAGRYLRYIPYLGAVKLLIIVGDILTAPQFGLTYLEFAQYLFGLWAYTGLVASQIAISVSSYIISRRT